MSEDKANNRGKPRENRGGDQQQPQQQQQKKTGRRPQRPNRPKPMDHDRFNMSDAPEIEFAEERESIVPASGLYRQIYDAARARQYTSLTDLAASCGLERDALVAHVRSGFASNELAPKVFFNLPAQAWLCRYLPPLLLTTEHTPEALLAALQRIEQRQDIDEIQLAIALMRTHPVPGTK